MGDEDKGEPVYASYADQQAERFPPSLTSLLERLQAPSVSSLDNHLTWSRFATKHLSTMEDIASILKEEKVRSNLRSLPDGFSGLGGQLTADSRPVQGCYEPYAFVNGVIFSSYTSFMSMMPTPPGQDPTLWQINLAGMGSGFVGATLTCPIELIKTVQTARYPSRMRRTGTLTPQIRQQSMPPHMNPSTYAVAWDILKTGGLRGLYRGYTATLIRESAYGPYEAVCRYFKWRRAKSGHPLEYHDHKHDLISEGEAELNSGLNWAELMTAGGVAGVVAWVATFPFDVFKTRMQSSSAWGDEASKVKLGLWQTAVTSVRKEGWRVMFVGLWPTIVREPDAFASYGSSHLHGFGSATNHAKGVAASFCGRACTTEGFMQGSGEGNVWGDMGSPGCVEQTEACAEPQDY
ncbi:carnitine/acyl carnitine carrier [Trichosporon asahii var. asahii CBS 8904]|uniref:Carnitine/acyl carnitine carrier n=2 Tax=Trichosporon asahii var. asahii TaxID=189963 RepID=K1W975_TRIAC|nr:carnitine/acyl carnitine carrier [Trichosporon asahii var. asahii CBS 2479]EJT51259.1 carnitine/acyl carnitine carrier [Trichosporon asahii var. asahii CBS 2479]EKD05378.1 carnitine/acyl carnitine carrier [Trichosporon asahii var. asahii CBS 8904]